VRSYRDGWSTAAVGVALALASGVAACGSSEDPLASKPAAAILAASTNAVAHATSVHVHSDLSSGKSTGTLDLYLAGNGGRGRITLLGNTEEILRLGNSLYVKGSARFDEGLERTTSTRVPRGVWIKVPANSRRLPQFGAATRMGTELRLLLASDGQPTKLATTAIKGQRTVALREAETRTSSRIRYIAATGTPYPLEILKQGHEHGEISFTDWNQPVSLTPPRNAVEVPPLR